MVPVASAAVPVAESVMTFTLACADILPDQVLVFTSVRCFASPSAFV